MYIGRCLVRDTFGASVEEAKIVHVFRLLDAGITPAAENLLTILLRPQLDVVDGGGFSFSSSRSFDKCLSWAGGANISWSGVPGSILREMGERG